MHPDILSFPYVTFSFAISMLLYVKTEFLNQLCSQSPTHGRQEDCLYIDTAWATCDMRSPLLTKNSKFFFLDHFHLKNRCLVHVHIYTAWATRDMQSPKFSILQHFYLKIRCLVYVYIYTAQMTAKCDHHFCKKMQNFQCIFSRSLVHVYIYTAQVTHDIQSPLLTKNSKFSILKHFHLKNRCLVHLYIDIAWPL